MRDDKAVFIPVETGIADQKNIEVVTGITKDDIVVTGPFRTLRTLESGAAISYNLESEGENEF